MYFLGLIGAATYDLAGTAFLVAAITLVRNLATSIGNFASGSVIDAIGPRRTTIIVCALTAVVSLAIGVAAITLVRNLATSIGNFASGSVIDAIGPRRTTIIVCALTAVVSLAIGLAPITEISLMIAAFALGLSGGFLNTATHAYPGYLVATLTGRQRLNGLMVLYSNIAFTGRQRLNGLMVLYSNIAFTLGPIFGGALVSTFSTQSVYLFMAAAMAAATVLAFGCHEELRPEHEEEAKTGVLSGMVDGARMTLRDHDLRLIFISGFLGFFAFGAFDSLESLFYRDVLEVDVMWLGWLSSVVGFTASIGAWSGFLGFFAFGAFDSLESLFYRDVLEVDVMWLGWLSSVVGFTASIGAWLLTKLPDRMANLTLLLGSLLGVGVASMIYVGTDILAIAIVGQALNGLAWGFLEPLQMILVQEKAPIAYLGRIMGFVRFGLMSAGVLPLLAAPVLAEVFGVQAVLFTASCGIALVGAVFFFTQLRRVSRSRR